MRFHYLPDGAPRSKLNTESAEYANIVASTNRFYDAAVARGMTPLPPEDEALLRRWMTRVLAGYWTHAGYLNWDTGFGFGRWHQMKKLGLAQQSLIGIAAGGRLSPSRNEAAWAKHILESGFALYERKLPDADRRRAGPVLSVAAAPAVERPGAARRVAHGRQRGARRVRRHPGPARAPSRRRCTRSTPTSAGWRSRRPPTTPRSRRSRRARIRTAGSTSRGSTTTARRWPRRSARERPRASACWCATAAGTPRLVTARPASDRTRPPPLRLVRAPRGVGSAGTPLRAVRRPRSGC